MCRAALHYLAVGATVLLVACDWEKKLPAGPSDLITGIVIYEHDNYGGASAHVTQDIKHLADFRGPCERSTVAASISHWNDCMSSVRVAPGWRAILYCDDDFDGEQLEVTRDIPSLRAERLSLSDKDGFNDCVTSIRVFRP
jgi:hypothetical protein